MKKKGWVPYPRYIFRKEIALSLVKNNLPEGSRFLEIGCAAGDFGITLSKNGYNGIMIDFSDEAAEQVVSNLKKEKVMNVQFERQDFLKFETEKKFDLVIMFEVLEHIEKDKEAFEKVKGLLKDGGMFLFSVPAKQKLWRAHDIIAGHIKRYEKEELVDLAGETGFEIVKFLSYGFPWLNIAKYLRDKLADRKLKKNEAVSRISLTKKSGLSVDAIRVPLLEMFFNKYILFLPMKISNLFNNKDLAEAYLCLAKKVIGDCHASFGPGRFFKDILAD